MNRYLILFREPDGNRTKHTDEELSIQQRNWRTWFEIYSKTENLIGGSALTLDGNIIKGDMRTVKSGIHQTEKEIIGGYLILEAKNLDMVTEIVKSCPIFEYGGYAEIREHQI